MACFKLLKLLVRFGFLFFLFDTLLIFSLALQVRSPGAADRHGGDGARLLPPGGEGPRQTLQHQFRPPHGGGARGPSLAHPLTHQHSHAAQQPGLVRRWKATLEYELT